jgi:hypothetical protein
MVEPQEKRLFPRVRLKAPVFYQVRGAPDGESTLSEDISVGGIAISDDNFVPIDTLMGLKIYVLSRVIAPIGRIAWISSQAHSGKFKMGIQFMELGQLEKEYLTDYIIMQRFT